MALASCQISPAPHVADLLLDIGVVGVNVEKPFIFTSGWASPVYTDCRKIISALDARRQIMSMAADMLKRAGVTDKIDFIAGGETAGIAYAAWLSELLDKPMLYVRKKPKGFGRLSQIEGEMPEGSRVLLVEDLTTDGASKVHFANALRDAGAQISEVFSVFYYGIMPDAQRQLSDAGLTLHYLCTWHDLLAAAKRRRFWPDTALVEIEAFLTNPAGWSAANGGK
jgi:orotate phosphoribosyltransferase